MALFRSRYQVSLEVAEDHVHDGLTRAWQKYHLFEDRGEGSFFGWSLVIITNLYFNKQKRVAERARRRNSSLDAAGRAFEGLASNHERAEDQKASRRISDLETQIDNEYLCRVAGLSELERLVFLLYFEGMKPREIALELGTSPGSVSNTVDRVRTKIKQVWPQLR